MSIHHGLVLKANRRRRETTKSDREKNKSSIDNKDPKIMSANKSREMKFMQTLRVEEEDGKLMKTFSETSRGRSSAVYTVER